MVEMADDGRRRGGRGQGRRGCRRARGHGAREAECGRRRGGVAATAEWNWRRCRDREWAGERAKSERVQSDTVLLILLMSDNLSAIAVGRNSYFPTAGR